MNNNLQQTINISTSTIFRVILILLGLFFLFIVRDIVLIVFISIVIAAAVDGPVSWLQRRRVPRFLGVIFIYLVVILILALLMTLVVPPLAQQVKQLAGSFPEFVDKTETAIEQWWGQYQGGGEQAQNILRDFSNRLSELTGNIFSGIVSLFGGIFSVFIILVISFYLALRENGMKSFVLSLTPYDHRHYVSDLIDRIYRRIGGWLRGQLLLMVVIGVLTYIGLLIFGVKYALTLAIIAGVLEIIPYLGPILAAIPAVVLAFLQSPVLAVWVVVLYIVIQQVENYVVVPQVMKKTVGLNPITIIIVMLIGAKLAGILGVVLSVPLAAAISEFWGDIREKKI
jgi:predicted PurR-regulated permease PerM